MTQPNANMDTLVTALTGLTNQLAEYAKRNASTHVVNRRTMANCIPHSGWPSEGVEDVQVYAKM